MCSNFPAVIKFNIGQKPFIAFDQVAVYQFFLENHFTNLWKVESPNFEDMEGGVLNLDLAF